MPGALNVPPLSKGAPTRSVGTADREEESVGGGASWCGAAEETEMVLTRVAITLLGVARGGEGGAAASGHPIATLGARRRVRRTQTLGIAPGHDLVAMADAQLE